MSDLMKAVLAEDEDAVRTALASGAGEVLAMARGAGQPAAASAVHLARRTEMRKQKQMYCIINLEGWQAQVPDGARYEIQVLDRVHRSKAEGYLFDEEKELVINGKPVPRAVLDAAAQVGSGDILTLDEDGNIYTFGLDVYQ